MFGETIEIIRGTPRDGKQEIRGNSTNSASERLVSAGWAVAPVAGSDIATPRGSFDAVGYTLYKPEQETILPTDRIVVRGRMHAVEGVASDWDSPFACGTGGVVVHVKRIN